MATTKSGNSMRITSSAAAAEEEVDLPEISHVEKTTKKKLNKNLMKSWYKPIKKKNDEPGPSIVCGTRTKTTTDTCSYLNYTGDKDWNFYVSCLQWVCGICSLGLDNPQYECPACSSCSICLVQFSEYTKRKFWIQCVTCKKWVCGHCNGGSKQVSYECAACFDDD